MDRQGGDGGSVDRSSRDAGLGGVEWRLTDVRSADGELLRVDPTVLATASFDGDRITGSAGCNRYVATCILEGSAIEVSGIASTLRACPPPSSTIETAFLAALDRASTFRLAEDALELLSADRVVLVRFEARPARSLSGVTWSALGINNGRGAVTSLLAGSEVTATFGTDGSISGRAGCNRFHGSYATVGSQLRIAALATTRMACPPPVMEQEAAFLAAIGRVAAFAFDGDRLELRSEDGALQVDLVVLEEG